MPVECGKGKETNSREPQLKQPYGHLAFSPVCLTPDVYSIELLQNKFALF